MVNFPNFEVTVIRISLDILLNFLLPPSLHPNLPNRIKDRLVNVKILIMCLSNFHKKNRVREKSVMM